ncbi:hypothetical protein [Aestuariibaculum suncheonense]|uniref:Tetratricopeptide repeat protein n=1 Tax=Aestuariibaculum suncheonense TaxID=1028745 RepID=A0A8J6QWB5_9FLAO|nr:hypothetical protein [Aestuariibaculum suncheonense]MBD0836124.1 hypothetical protein [Aestuariibaculum suncheonense]
MNPTDFTYILQHPQSITHEQTEAVKSIIDEFPYFQPARAIYLKGLKDQSSFKYNQELKITAAYTTDRSILFDFITSDVFLQNEISESIKQNITNVWNIEVDYEDISVNRRVEIDDNLQQQVKDTTGVLDPALFQPKEIRTPKPVEVSLIDTESKPEETESPVKILNIGKPFEFEKNETHSFNEWLQLTRFKPINRNEPVKEAKQTEPTPKQELATKHVSESSQLDILEREKKFELIDKFIQENPKINPTKTSATKGNLAKAQMIQPEALMTETLARIYVEQKNYKKAIQSYKILSLKYPEKNSFFANQIKAVQQLQEQNKLE